MKQLLLLFWLLWGWYSPAHTLAPPPKCSTDRCPTAAAPHLTEEDGTTCKCSPGTSVVTDTHSGHTHSLCCRPCPTGITRTPLTCDCPCPSGQMNCGGTCTNGATCTGFLRKFCPGTCKTCSYDLPTSNPEHKRCPTGSTRGVLCKTTNGTLFKSKTGDCEAGETPEKGCFCLKNKPCPDDQEGKNTELVKGTCCRPCPPGTTRDKGGCSCTPEPCTGGKIRCGRTEYPEGHADYGKYEGPSAGTCQNGKTCSGMTGLFCPSQNCGASKEHGLFKATPATCENE